MHSQQQYKTHPLFCLEKFLNKNEVLMPKGPVLGYFAGQPVYAHTHARTPAHTQTRSSSPSTAAAARPRPPQKYPL